MNGKTVKVLRRWARIKGYTDKSVKNAWYSFDRLKKKQAKRFFLHVIDATARAARKEAASAPAQA